MVTIKQVARLAGVSASTASYALNGRPEIKPETTQRVLEAARQLQYVPNRMAQNFRNKKTNTLMVVTCEGIENDNTFTTEFFGILSVAREQQYDVLVKLIDPLWKSNSYDLSSFMGNRMCDGYLLLGNHLDCVIEYVVERNLPAVLLSAHSSQNIVQINVDGYRWIYNMTKLVLKKKSHPVYLTYKLEDEEEKLRKEGFCAMLKDSGYAPSSGENDLVYCCGENGRDLSLVIEKSLSWQADAFVCWNDTLAIQVLDLLRKKKIRVPQDAVVTGFDDAAKANNEHWKLTTVSQLFVEKGRTAMVNLLKQMNGETPEDYRIFLDCNIVRRKTC